MFIIAVCHDNERKPNLNGKRAYTLNLNGKWVCRVRIQRENSVNILFGYEIMNDQKKD
jgi:hypothetical protein